MLKLKNWEGSPTKIQWDYVSKHRDLGLFQQNLKQDASSLGRSAFIGSLERVYSTQKNNHP